MTEHLWPIEPGMLERGTPIIISGEHACSSVVTDERPGLGRGWVWTSTPGADGGRERRVSLGFISIDLRARNGQANAAQWFTLHAERRTALREAMDGWAPDRSLDTWRLAINPWHDVRRDLHLMASGHVLPIDRARAALTAAREVTSA